MNLEKILKRLQVYTNIPRLQFQFETEEYVYMADTMDQVNYILQNLELIEGAKQNLKKYKDDKETISNIKEGLKYYEETIEKSMENLEENYLKHCNKLNRLAQIEEEENGLL